MCLLVFVIKRGCGAFITPSCSGTIALFWSVSPEGSSSIRGPWRSVCQWGLVWDWVSTATWSSEHRNAIVPTSRLRPDRTHAHKEIHARGLIPACLFPPQNLGHPALLHWHYSHAQPPWPGSGCWACECFKYQWAKFIALPLFVRCSSCLPPNIGLQSRWEVFNKV